MDMAGKDTNVEPQKGCEDPQVNYNSHSFSSNWQLNETNLTNPASIGMVPMGNSMVESSACSSGPMADSFCSPVWDQSISGQGLNYCDVNIPNDGTTSSSIGRAGGMKWTQNTAMLRGPMFLPTLSGMVSPNLPHFPADSAFIERAARFSCFSGGNFSEMMNPFSVPDPMNPYSRGLGHMTCPPHDVFGGNGAKSLPGMQSQRHEMQMNEVSVSKEGTALGEHGTERSPLKKSENFMHSHEEAKHGVDGSGNESDEAEFSGRVGQEDVDGAAGESSGKGLGSKKRKRAGQASEFNENKDTPQHSVENARNASEIREKGDENPSSAGKSGGKNVKQGSQGSDQAKEEYIHVRARRGQATNSHSLAERVRREKISERMKFLQDLVPGCSKVTGKAVMLDEIINYVQSLQRQVEFLSMKLATVNPRLDFNIEGFLSKDILQPRAGLTSPMVFPPDMSIMPFPQLHPSQSGLIQVGHPGIGTSSDAVRRPINLGPTAVCGGFKEPPSQAPNVWEDELHNVVHMGFNSSTPPNDQDLAGSLPAGRMKTEP